MLGERDTARAQCHGQTFNIGADQPYSVAEVATEVARALGLEPKLMHLPARNEVEHAYASHAKVERYFGASKKTSLTEGLQKMAAWVKTVSLREPIRFKNIEILKNLPPSWR